MPSKVPLPPPPPPSSAATAQGKPASRSSSQDVPPQLPPASLPASRPSKVGSAASVASVAAPSSGHTNTNNDDDDAGDRTATMLESSSALQPRPREHVHTPAAVSDRLKEELELERARVRMHEAQERAAWAEVGRLRAELDDATAASSELLKQTRRPPLPADASAAVVTPPPAAAVPPPQPQTPAAVSKRTAAVQVGPDAEADARDRGFAVTAADTVVILDHLLEVSLAADGHVHVHDAGGDTSVPPMASIIDARRLVAETIRHIGVEALASTSAADNYLADGSPSRRPRSGPPPPPLVPASIERVAHLVAELRATQHALVTATASRDKWRVWSTACAARVESVQAAHDAVLDMYRSDVSDAYASAHLRQAQLHDVVSDVDHAINNNNQPRSSSSVASSTSLPSAVVSGDTSAAPTEHQRLLQDVVDRARDAAQRERATLSALAAATGQQRAEKLLVGYHRRSLKLRHRVESALHGAPVDASVFDGFLRQHWRRLKTDAENSPSRGCDYDDAGSGVNRGDGPRQQQQHRPVVGTADALVRVWRELQVHAAGLAQDAFNVGSFPSRAASSASPPMRQWADDDDDGGARCSSDECAFLSCLGAEHLLSAVSEGDEVGATTSAFRRPFGDDATPTWSQDADRVTAALESHLGGFMPSTESDFVCFFIALACDAVLVGGDGGGGRNRSATAALSTSDDHQIAIVSAAELGRLRQLAADLDQVTAEKENQRHRADTLDAANRALVALQAEEISRVRTAASAQVRTAMEQSLRRCPDTFRLYAALRGSPYFCLDCGAEMPLDVGTRWFVDAIEPRSSSSSETAVTIEDFDAAMADTLLARTNEAVVAARRDDDQQAGGQSAAMKLATSTQLPSMLWTLAPDRFADVLETMTVTDDVEPFTLLRRYFGTAPRAATELTHHTASRLLAAVRFVWLPAEMIEQCLESMSVTGGLSSAVLSPVTSDDDGDDEAFFFGKQDGGKTNSGGAYQTFLRQLEGRTNAAARLKLLGLSKGRQSIGAAADTRDDFPTPLAAALRLGIVTASGDVGRCLAPRESHYLIETLRREWHANTRGSSSSHRDGHQVPYEHLCTTMAEDWATFGAMLRRVEAAWHQQPF